MKNLRWEFAPTAGGPDDGISNSMIEYFLGDYNYHLAREIIQNSIDARHDEEKPVEVIFKLEYFKQSEFPGGDEFLDVLNSCKKFWPKDAEKTQIFLEQAFECISSDKIPVLKISDYNTKGLWGSDEDIKGGWYNLVKSRGASYKTAGEGGAFGIGKGAPFAASLLRTIFYSTTNQKDSRSSFIGMTELASFIDKDNVKRRGCGSFGEIGQCSVRTSREFPGNFWRKEKGLDIYIMGYKKEKNWKESLIKSILRNFWYAIFCNELKVVIDDISISSDNLEEQLTKHFLSEPFKDYVKPIGNPLQYYLAVKKSQLHEGKLPTLGNVKLYLLLTEAHLNYVAMLRKSHMVIFSKRFNFPGNYAGVFVCDDKKGNEELRKMEPPAHDEWIPERNREKGEKIMEEIISFIRERLESLKNVKESGVLGIPELHKYMPYDEGDETGESKGGTQYTGQEAEAESSKLLQRKEQFKTSAVINPFRVTVMNSPDTGEDSDGTGSGKGGGGGGNGGGGSGGGGKRKSFRKDSFHARPFLISQSKNEMEYLIIVHNKITQKCNLKITAVGEEGNEKIKIKSVFDEQNKRYHFAGGIINSIHLESNQDLKLKVKILSSFKCSLKIEAYAL